MMTVRVAGRPPDVADRPVEKRLFLQALDTFHDRIFRPRDHVPSLMRNQSAESASAGTPAHCRNRVLDSLECRNLFFIRRMRTPCITELAHTVEFSGGHRRLRRFHQHITPVVILQQLMPAPGIHLFFDDDHLVHHRIPVVLHLLERGKHHIRVVNFKFRGCLSPEKTRSPLNAIERFAVLDSMEYLRRGKLPLPVDQDIRLGVNQHARSDLILPVVIMSNTAHARLHSAEHSGNSRKRRFAELGIDNGRHLRFEPGAPARRINVVTPEAAPDGINTEHGIHIAGCDSTGDARPAHHLDRIGIPPVRLCNDADPPPFRQQKTPDQRHGKRGMIHICVARHKQNIEFLPAEMDRLGAAHGNEFRFVFHKKLPM